MEPQWLDADERAAWLRLAAVTELLPAALDTQLRRDYGLTHFEYFVLAMLSTAMVFGTMTERSQIFWMIPIMGFCQLTLFGGYSIYFAELFPTRLRSTGTSFCYNVGRLVAAMGPLLLGKLSGVVYASHGPVDSMRYAGITMCSVFLIGLMALPFAPETKGKPLPE